MPCFMRLIRSWQFIGAVLGAIVLVGIVVVGVAIYRFYDVPRLSREAETIVATYRAAGLPWVASDLMISLEAEEDATELLKESCEMAEEFLPPSVERQLEDLWENRDYEGLKTHLTELEDVLKGVHATVARRKLSFNRDWDEGAAVRFPEYATLRRLARVLRLECVSRAYSGDVGGALGSLAAIRKLARLVVQEPTMISMMTAMAISSTANEAAEHLATLFADKPQLLREMKDVMIATRLDPDPIRALMGDLYMGIATMRNVKNYSSEEDWTIIDRRAIVRDGIPNNRFMRAQFAGYLRFWTRTMPRLNQLRGDPVAQLRTFEELTDREIGVKTASKLMTAILVPPTSGAAAAVQRYMARHEILVALIEALVFKFDNGRFPNSIEELGGDRIDPFDGTPLKIRAYGEGIRVYSVGYDGIDDGGTMRSELPSDRSREKGWDFVVRFPFK